MELSPDGKFLFVGCTRLGKKEDPKVKGFDPGIAPFVTLRLILGGEIQVLDSSQLKVISRIQVNTDNAHRFAFTPDQKFFATCGDEEGISLWRVADQKQVAFVQYKAHYLAFSKDGYQLGACFENKVLIWDVRQLCQPEGTR